MDLNQFTEKAQQALAGAQKLAARFSHQQIDVEHAILSLLDQEKGLAPAVEVDEPDVEFGQPAPAETVAKSDQRSNKVRADLHQYGSERGQKRLPL